MFPNRAFDENNKYCQNFHCQLDQRYKIVFIFIILDYIPPHFIVTHPRVCHSVRVCQEHVLDDSSGIPYVFLAFFLYFVWRVHNDRLGQVSVSSSPGSSGVSDFPSAMVNPILYTKSPKSNYVGA